jgi:CO/xanthine dehydrogenase Mo-binding subunit
MNSGRILNKYVNAPNYILYANGQVKRIDSLEKVKGLIKYTTDYIEVEALYLKVFRSPVPHAIIKEISFDKALKVDGVKRIVTAKDIPGVNQIGFFLEDQPLLAHDKVRFVGDPIAAVVAEYPEAAKVALEHIDVKFEILPAITDSHEALKANAPKIHEDGNLIASYFIKKGDVDKGFKDADVILEGTYKTQYQEHAFLETEAALAIPAEDGITVIGSMQVPFAVEKAIRRVLGKAVENVRIIQAAVGGGFGGKEDSPDEVCADAALAAYLTNKPVLYAFSRKETTEVHAKRHPTVIKRKLGAKRHGQITALWEEILFDGGAYASLSPRVCFRAVTHAPGPYIIPNIFVEGKAVYTNKVPSGAFRGFGKPQVHFAAEVQMDELARELNIDPIELRLKNIVKEGSEGPMGQKLTDVGLEKCILAVRNSSNWDVKRKEYSNYFKKNPTKKRGIGIAITIHAVGVGVLSPDVGSAIVELDKFGNIIVRVALVEMGQGIFTVLAQMAASYLDLPINKIKIMYPDTGEMYDSGPTVASRSTVVGGRALRVACERLKKLLIKKVAKEFEVSEESIEMKGGVFKLKEGRRLISIEELAYKCHLRGEKLTAEGWVNMNESVYWDDEKGQGAPFPCYSYAAHIAEVEVDLETGKVDIIKYYAAHDSGKIINKMLAKGQVYGGVVQGIGYALMEELIVKQGKILNPTFLDYYIPTSMDVPEIIPIFIEDAKWKQGPFGAKGLAELGLNPVAASIGNAIMHALGIPIRDIPFTPEKILSNVKKGEKR